MDGRIQRVLTLIGNNLHKKVSVNNLAQRVNLSPWHLHRLFKAETGIPPAKYITTEDGESGAAVGRYFPES
jgi:transcriptional regulator GlxA family with amidase domain